MGTPPGMLGLVDTIPTGAPRRGLPEGRPLIGAVLAARRSRCRGPAAGCVRSGCPILQPLEPQPPDHDAGDDRGRDGEQGAEDAEGGARHRDGDYDHDRV